MSVTDAQVWIDHYNGIEHPRRELPADALCENDIGFVTEDEDNWIFWWYDPRKEPEYYLKSEYPHHPYALVVKWGFKAVNVDRINENGRTGK